MVEIGLKRQLGGMLLLGSSVLLWQGFRGLAVPGLAAAPAGDPGLCLALAFRSMGGAWFGALSFWLLSSLWAGALSCVDPFWVLLAGMPVWLFCLPRRPGRGGTALVGELLLAGGLLSLSRVAIALVSCALSWPGALTVSGGLWWDAVRVELIANLACLSLFTQLWCWSRPVE